MNVIKQFKPSDTIVIALFTCIAYFSAFLYESGYLSYYKVSPRFIFLDSSAVIFAFIIITILLLPFLLFSIILFHQKKEEVIYQEIKLITFIAICLMPFAIFKYNSIFYVISFVIIIYLLNKIANLFLSKGKSLKEKIKNFIKANLKVSKNRMHRLTLIGYLLFYSFYVLIVSYPLGKYNASNQINFYVLQYDEELVIINVYNENVYAMPLDRSKKTLKNELKILKYEDISDDKIVIKIEQLGAIKIAEQITMCKLS